MQIQNTRTIFIRDGYKTIVDEADYDWLNQWKWTLSKNNKYVRRTGWANGKQKTVVMHRLIMGYPELSIDHINGNTLDNRRANLRAVTSFQNQHNRGMSRNNTSGYMGVCWSKRFKKWQADIKISGKSKFLGRFDDVKEAAMAYRKAAIERDINFVRLSVLIGVSDEK